LVIALVSCLLVIVGSGAWAEDCDEVVGRWPYGLMTGIAISGDTGYVITGSVFQTLDLSEPTTPVVLGELDLPWAGGWVVVRGSFAYLVNRDLLVVDVSVPSAPVEVGSLTTEWWLTDVTIAGDRLVARAGPGLGFCVIDLGVPTAPVVAHRIEIEDDLVVGFAASERYLFVGVLSYNTDDGIRIFDIGQPSGVVEVGFESVDQVWSVAVQEQTLFLTTSSYLMVMDVSTPSDPELIGYLSLDDIGSWIERMVPSGDLVLAIGHPDFFVFDLTDPTDPTLIGRIDVPDPNLLAAAGMTALVGDAELLVVDLTVPASPEIVGSHEVFGSSLESVASGHHSFVAARSGLRVFDIENPVTLTEVAALDDSSYAQAIAFQNDLVYLVEIYGGFRIVDVAEPTAPVVLSTTRLYPYEYTSIDVAAGFAFVSVSDGVQVIDISNPTQPTDAGMAYGAEAHDLVADGAHVYVATWPDGLEIFEPAPFPLGLNLIATLPMVNWVLGLAQHGDYVYLTDGDLRVINVSDPTTPIEVGMVEMPEGAEDVTVIGSRAYVRGTDRKIWVVDVGDPQSPLIVGTIETPGSPLDVDLANGHLIVSDGRAGLTVVRGCQFFYDGFESGDPTSWSELVK
jgi:hypothetical protein